MTKETEYVLPVSNKILMCTFYIKKRYQECPQKNNRCKSVDEFWIIVAHKYWKKMLKKYNA